MAKGNRPNEQPPVRGGKRRRRPPVLELKATEIGGADARAGTGRSKAESPQGPRAGDAWQERLAALDWRALAARPALAGGAGVLAGAALVFGLMSLIGGERAGEARVGELSGEVAALGERIEALAKRPAPVATVPNMLGERIDRLTAAVGATEQRLAAIEQRPAPPVPDLSVVNQRTATIESSLKDLRTALNDVRRMTENTPPAATPKAVDTLADRIGGLDARIAALAAPRPAPSVAALATEIAALNALSAAVQAGRPFTAELEAVRARFGERAAPLVTLEPFAATGLPTVAALTGRFSALAPELLRNREPASGVISRLVSNLSGLVQVRRVGEPQGASVDAVVARMETKLERGELGAALVEAERLPEPAKSAAADWMKAAAQRRDAARLIQELTDAALTGTGRKQS